MRDDNKRPGGTTLVPRARGKPMAWGCDSPRHICGEIQHTGRRSTTSVATLYHKSSVAFFHALCQPAMSHGSAHASLSLDVSVASTPIPHLNAIPPYLLTYTTQHNLPTSLN